MLHTFLPRDTTKQFDGTLNNLMVLCLQPAVTNSPDIDVFPYYLQHCATQCKLLSVLRNITLIYTKPTIILFRSRMQACAIH